MATGHKFKVQTDKIIEKPLAGLTPDGHSPGSTCTERYPREQSAWGCWDPGWALTGRVSFT